MVAADPESRDTERRRDHPLVGPDRWLVVEPDGRGAELVARLSEASPARQRYWSISAMVGRVFRITGRCSRDLLAKGCGIDFHPTCLSGRQLRAKPSGSCRARFCMQSIEAPSFDLLRSRSFALTVWEWLTESPTEYGCRIETRSLEPVYCLFRDQCPPSTVVVRAGIGEGVPDYATLKKYERRRSDRMNRRLPPFAALRAFEVAARHGTSPRRS